MIFISVVRDFDMYDKCVLKNPFNADGKFVFFDNREENIAVPVRYNDFLDSYDYKNEDWFIFCHEDWQALGEYANQLDYLDKNSIYGTCGAKLKFKGKKKGYKMLLGNISVCNKNGSGLISLGMPVNTGEAVETFDCMCIIMHSSLIKKYKIRFDEKLDWHHYVEELNIRMNEDFNVKSRILQMPCKHWSCGVSLPNEGFDAAWNYVNEKFKDAKSYYSNTVSNNVVGPEKIKVLKKSVIFDKLKKFFYQKKETKSGKTIIKIFKIPVYVRKKTKPVKFSIIMPTHNRAFCIIDAIDSVLAQTYQDFELIIIDDGSTDDTDKLIKKKYASELKLRKIIYTKIDKRGVCSARNVGLNLSSNPWIAYCDTDNKMHLDFLETFKGAINKHKNTTCFYAKFKTRNSQQVVGHDFDYKTLTKGNYIDLGVFVHSKKLFENLGGFDTNLKRLVDYDLILTYTKNHPAIFIDKILLDYNDDDKIQRISCEGVLADFFRIVWKKHGLNQGKPRGGE